MRFDFYQLTRDPAEKLVPAICEKIMPGGGRTLILSADDGQLGRISDALWSHRDSSFLAHSEMGGREDPAIQPILLGKEAAAPNDAAHVIISDGQWREFDTPFKRIFFLFEPQHVEAARAAWRSLKERPGISRHFWEQAEGRWIERG